MSEYVIEKRVGDLIVRAYGISAVRYPSLSSVAFAYEGESPRLELRGPDVIEELPRPALCGRCCSRCRR